jgi:hypothetical protein
LGGLQAIGEHARGARRVKEKDSKAHPEPKLRLPGFIRDQEIGLGDLITRTAYAFGFIRDQEIGLGDLITRTAYAFGIRPCGGCQKRAALMNRLVAFGPRKSS